MKKLINLRDKYLGHFKVNVGEVDRMIRVCVGSAILILSVMLLSEVYQIIGLIIGIGLISTGLIGFCWLYSLIGVNTCDINKKAKKRN